MNELNQTDKSDLLKTLIAFEKEARGHCPVDPVPDEEEDFSPVFETPHHVDFLIESLRLDGFKIIKTE